MIDEKHLINGKKYKCLVNDIVTAWIEELSWVGGRWIHETKNDEYGQYPCIVDYAIHEVTPNDPHL